VSLFVSLTRRRRQRRAAQEEAASWRPLQRVLQREKQTQEGWQARFYSECSNASQCVRHMMSVSATIAFVHRFCQVWGPGLWIMTSGSDAHRLYECGVRGFVKSGVWGFGVMGSGNGCKSLS
jgi:hypothetical protein